MVQRTNGREYVELVTNAAPLLAGRLVEPCLDIVLPVLLEVPVGDDIVVLHPCSPYLQQIKQPKAKISIPATM
jgi:hypothetical protein